MTDPSGTIYRIDQLKVDNWIPWRRRMEALLVDRDLIDYVDGTIKEPVAPAATDLAAMAAYNTSFSSWKPKNAKAKSLLVMAISDGEMIHIEGATTAMDMWNQLCLLKEPKGPSSIVSTRRRLYRLYAEEGTDIVAHISELRKLQNQLHMMGSKVSDEDFNMLLVSSLPESWDLYTSAYFGAHTGTVSITSHELCSIIMDEYRRRAERSGSSDSALLAKANKEGRPVCTNPKCKRKVGHTFAKCWAPGGGAEGQGPRQKRKDKSNQAEDNEGEDVAYNAVDSTPQFDSRFANSQWLADSGTTSHITPVREAFLDYTPLPSSSIKGVGDNRIKAEGRGTVKLSFNVDGQIVKHSLKNVLYAPAAVNSLLSISRLDEAGLRCEFGQGKCVIRQGSHVIGQGKKDRRLYVLNATFVLPPRSNLASSDQSTDTATWDEWHRRFGHLAISGLVTLHRQHMVDGLHIDEASSPSEKCDACIQAKFHVRPFPKESTSRSSVPGDRTHSDLWGKAQATSLGGKIYYVSFTDDCTRHCAVYFMSKKSETFAKLKLYMSWLERQGKHPKAIRIDNGKEYVNREITSWCQEKGISIETTAPYSPSQNGVAERFNRTLLELARAMLFARHLPSFLWSEAVSYAAYIRNRAPTQALDGKTPHEAFTGRKPDVSHLREFGSDIWILDQRPSRQKLDPKARKFIFVGYDEGSKGVRYFDKIQRQVRVSRNFSFGESSPEVQIDFIFPDSSIEGVSSKSNQQSSISNVQSSSSMGNPPNPPNPPTGIAPHVIPPPTVIPPPSPVAPPPTRKKGFVPSQYAEISDKNIIDGPRRRNQPDYKAMDSGSDEQANFASESFDFTFSSTDVAPEVMPQSLDEAKRSPEWPDWQKAIDAELAVLHSKGTWKLTELPKDRKPVENRWVFAKKYDENGIVTQYKARLVAKGYSQVPGVDYQETFSPVARLDSLRTMFSVAAINDWEIHMMDVKSAYLNGDLEEEIYMLQPEGYEDGTGRVCLLIKTIYGLKQSGRQWNRKLDRILHKHGYTRLETDHCVYKKTSKDGRTLIYIWVDDMVLFASSLEALEELKSILKSELDIKDIGEPKYFLGIEITRDRVNRTISLSQKNYVDTIVRRMNLQDAKPVSTPMNPSVTLVKKEDGPRDPKQSYRYAMAIGSLMYAALGTRPDIAFAVQCLSQFSANPSPEHWTAVKRVFRYLLGTRTYSLTLGACSKDEVSIQLNGYADADWGSNPVDRKSVSGYTFLINDGAIAWSSKKQPTVALSSTEAEYIASTHAARQIIWLRQFLSELEFPEQKPTTLHNDNKGAIALSKDPQFHARSKHIDIQHHFIREKIADGLIEIIYCPTDDMLADLFTKGLPKPKHEGFTKSIGVSPV